MQEQDGGGSEPNADLYLLEDGRAGRWEDRCFSWHGQTVETFFFFVGFSGESKMVAFVSKELLGCVWVGTACTLTVEHVRGETM